ncbi:DUF3304 domain-containing protein [Piscinibacter terrae]|uniref:DUF3304 domain-containing protein n=1 Tax=Piscinibacter terrae TaxID=2496871 RepID=UPI0013866085|nr:DUF3304 domain-containing protein [Albitalea terrae]
MTLALSGCIHDKTDEQSLAPGDVAKWNDPNYAIVGIGTFNYTNDDLFDTFVLPVDKSDIKFAALASGNRATPRDEKEWWMHAPSSPDLAWDYRWTTPKAFKVWWLRVFDRETYSRSAGTYDKYTMKESAPGTAWCEAEIQVQHVPRRDKKEDLVIHFFSDGHIEGDIVPNEGVVPKVELRKRDEQAKLEGKACLKEVSNPYFGKPKPVGMY